MENGNFHMENGNFHFPSVSFPWVLFPMEMEIPSFTSNKNEFRA
jgi:hypothetical protein